MTPPAPAGVTASGHDYATSVQVTLTVTPGTPGPNRFAATVVDYDTHRPFPAQRVALTLTLPARPDVGASHLDLTRGPQAGHWQAQGSQLSLGGRWAVTVLVQGPSGAVTVPLSLASAAAPVAVAPPQTLPQLPGQPVVYQLPIGGGQNLQAYIDPGHPGSNQVHLTFFDASGNELPAAAVRLAATSPRGPTRQLALIPFSPGHYAANAALTAGRWSFAVTATVKGGANAGASFSQDIK
jgi:hypothetical protein